jgi:cysteine desulfurase
VTSSVVGITKDGKIDYADLEKQLYHFSKVGRHCFVSLMGANNETGVLLNAGLVGELCKEFHAIFHSDGVQTVGHYPVDVKEIGVHLLSAAGHKFGGPKGVGILYKDERIEMEPLIFGGVQEMGNRAGTENVAAIVGFAKALEIAMRDFGKNALYILGLKERLAYRLKERIEGISFNGHPEEGLYTVLSVNFPKNEFSSSLLMELDSRGICVSGGSACSMGAGSHVMRELGKSGDSVTIRFSFSAENTVAEIDRTVEVVGELLRVDMAA